MCVRECVYVLDPVSTRLVGRIDAPEVGGVVQTVNFWSTKCQRLECKAVNTVLIRQHLALAHVFDPVLACLVDRIDAPEVCEVVQRYLV